ncbi:secreted RxLR effector protein 78-like [Cryptomeria japonica]|uniref:secreted RxLR effector protein 78-like n=1 Tax=Cryptomeria japonica TaxID=3369 RepID=UPI0027DA967B|nr:secreted RxLR effector protein 78-like [Cryptomeria japonica]
MEWARRFSQKSLFLKIDSAKAYDRIEWPFILAMLKALGFGPHFIQSMQILVRDAYAYITINDHKSSSFRLFKSIRQGCPLEPSLYVLPIEGFGYFLASAISIGRIKGISLPESPSQLVNGHFADDSFVSLLGGG